MAKPPPEKHGRPTPEAETRPVRPDKEVAATPPGPGAEDRPGFDLGGSVEDTSAGSGVGLGNDASEDRTDRRLPGRRGEGDPRTPDLGEDVEGA